MRAGEHPPAGARAADRYTIVEPISAGSMGAVYRARDEAGAEVALKRLTDHTQAARFEIEGRHVRAQQVVHRTVKPSNQILLDSGIVLVDFGIGRECDPARADGTQIGTPLYVGPEVAAGPSPTSSR